MDPLDSVDPYGRPARRTQWIVSTLAYHYGLDRGVENEIIVLATGLDQYLQEIFHHLDYKGGGKISTEDFNILCEILGLNKELDDAESASNGLSNELTFRHFHAKLCGYFSAKAGCQYENDQLLVGRDSEHIETQIRLRSPLRRREKLSVCVSGGSSPSPEERSDSGRMLGSCSRECYEEIVALEEAEDRIAKLEDENASLRELIEDMRAALQSSDARCLALQVGLWKSYCKHKAKKSCLNAHQKHSSQKSISDGKHEHTTYSSLKSMQNIIQEIELLQISRSQQIEEAMLCNQKLEQELWSCRETLTVLEDCNQVLKREQVSIRKKVEEARQSLLSGLDKVRDLESKASHVPALQRYILWLESELLHSRAEVSTNLQIRSTNDDEHYRSDGSRLDQRYYLDFKFDRYSPTGHAVATPEKMEDQLFRSVEGQAASDEEEDKLTRTPQKQVDEVKGILMQQSGCGESSRNEESFSAVANLMDRLNNLHKQLELKESRGEMDVDQILLLELEQKAEETELLQVELQMLEKERVCLSLVEEKLVAILLQLQQLRDLNITRRSFGKMCSAH